MEPLNAKTNSEKKEIVIDQVAISFGFELDWSRKCCEFCDPITKRGKTKTKQFQIIYDNQFITALTFLVITF